MPRLLPRRVVADRRGGESKSKIYDRVNRGTITPPVKIGRSSKWPEHEIDTINTAIIEGRSEDQIRELVKDLIAARTASQGGAP